MVLSSDLIETNSYLAHAARLDRWQIRLSLDREIPPEITLSNFLIALYLVFTLEKPE
jgi:hypothetical protein